MEKGKLDWPTINPDFKVNEEDITRSGFEPDPKEYIINKQETTATAPRINVDPSSNTIDRLEGNLAPKVKDPNQVGKVYAEEGRQSIEPKATSGYVAEEKIPDSFLTPAPFRETPAEKNFFDKFRGWLAGK